MDYSNQDANEEILANGELHDSAPQPDEHDTSPPRGNPFPVVGIGASAGGIESFKHLLSALPPQTGMAFVLIQHLDPNHASQLCEILQPLTQMKVETVWDGIALQPNHVYVIPPNTTMVLADGTLRLAPRPPGLHLPIDIFFQSLASIQGSKAIGIVLSGNAADGSEGLKAIKAECGITMAQDEITAAFSGMPRNAAATGVVDFILPPAEIARELTRLSGHPFLIPPVEYDGQIELLPGGEPELRKIFALLQATTKVDFSEYKKKTIRRRIGRRMMVHRSKSLAEYAAFAEEHPVELRELYRDLLITVTSFFREPQMFEKVAQIFRERMESNSDRRHQPIRVWVPGCATGEELYSLAICLREVVDELRVGIPLHFFGTDISDASVDRARSGVYPATIANDVSPERLARFFVKVDSGYQILKAVRESCVFARQDVTKDPPFSRMDIVSCRNVLIYMNSALQRRVFPIFHYSLNRDGLLLLGSAESITIADDLFHVLDKQNHIYAPKVTAVRMVLDIGAGRTTPLEAPPPDIRPTSADGDAQRRIERVILNRYSPDSVVVDSDLKILHFRGDTSPYLQPGQGEASLHLLRMAQESLLAPL
ncbi:MAG TPA: chemotaxis protein CheB, partial [Bryobacteraceae bacterium]|nr:chemotaxis protein CheB [Bryobacteraceae bacterium]